ncbi:hypothetical protein Dsin_017728 [Dipteronia sinensis]|uniref:Amino acid transporter transmembrane domain-containing protein n=1 Tax=Dipteronia sinensis TaxID=43782 RepID=A0AAE0E700_9ROSI|nr:hypothetical protein Dsin_017728 [Dipteronia sinensis]
MSAAKRTGTVWTASAHLLTAIVGSGVLSLAWGIALDHWCGSALYTSGLLADCYRTPITGKRNHTYKNTVKTFLEIFLSQISNFDKLSWLSTVEAIVSFGYAGIGMGLSFAKIISGKGEKANLTGYEIGVDLTATEKTWRMFRKIGDMPYAIAFSVIRIEFNEFNVVNILGHIEIIST